VVRVTRVVRVPILRKIPINHLTHVLDQSLTFSNILHSKHTGAMHAGASGLNPSAGRNFAFFRHA
jgi:hypothetical protein